jgi:hypothetical protein
MRGGKTSASERSSILLKLADRLEANLALLAYGETVDNGKPIPESPSADIPLAIDHVRCFAGCARAQEGGISEIDENTLAYSIREPLGVVGLLIPWNFPILLAAWKMPPALAAIKTGRVWTHCYLPGEITMGAGDVYLGEGGGCAFYIGKAQWVHWRAPHPAHHRRDRWHRWRLFLARPRRQSVSHPPAVVCASRNGRVGRARCAASSGITPPMAQRNASPHKGAKDSRTACKVTWSMSKRSCSRAVASR